MLQTELLPHSIHPVVDRVAWRLLPALPLLLQLLLALAPEWTSWLELIAIIAVGFGIWFWHDSRGRTLSRAATLALAGTVPLLIILLVGNYSWTDFIVSFWLGGWIWAWQREKLLKRAGRVVYGSGIFLTTLTYIALVLLPFYGNGIHLRSYEQIAGHFVKPERFAPYTGSWPCGGPLLASATIYYFFTPVIMIPLALLLVQAVRADWYSIRWGETILWSVLLGACVLIIGLSLKDWGTIGTWLLS